MKTVELQWEAVLKARDGDVELATRDWSKIKRYPPPILIGSQPEKIPKSSRANVKNSVSEAEVKRVVTRFLAVKGWHVVDTEAGAVVRGSGRGGIVKKGEPDTRAFKGAYALHIEFKSPTGQLKKHQIQRHKYLATFGIRVHVIRGVKDAEVMLKAEGF